MGGAKAPPAPPSPRCLLLLSSIVERKHIFCQQLHSVGQRYLDTLQGAGGGGGGGEGQWGQNLPPPVPCSPASRTFISLLPPFSCFRKYPNALLNLKKIAFRIFLPLPALLELPLPALSSPASRTPPALYSPGLPPPCPPPPPPTSYTSLNI